MADYAHAEEVYREVRESLAPWTIANGFQRWPGTVAGWQKELDAERLLRFKFEGTGRMGDRELGHSLTAQLQLDPAPGEPAATPIRQSSFSSCLVGEELDRFAAVQGAINRRRPALPAQFKADLQADTLLGRHLRSLYEPSPKYLEGEYVPLSYHGTEDIREWTRFLIDVLPAALDRFVQGRNPRPIDTTPAHLKPKWLGGARPR